MSASSRRLAPSAFASQHRKAICHRVVRSSGKGGGVMSLPCRIDRMRRRSVSHCGSAQSSRSNRATRLTGPWQTDPSPTSSRRRPCPSPSATCSRPVASTMTVEEQESAPRSKSTSPLPAGSARTDRTAGSWLRSKNRRAVRASMAGSSAKHQPPSCGSSLPRKDVVTTSCPRGVLLMMKVDILRAPADPFPGPARRIARQKPIVVPLRRLRAQQAERAAHGGSEAVR